VLGLLSAVDASILTSAWENFPHGVVESLAVGTPVILTRAGGVAEVLHDGENGLLVDSRDPSVFAAAIRRYLREPGLAARLRAAAAPSVAAYDADAVYARLESILEAAR
jgi:glycosyltransferase involved in cell wall biosynthesis